MADAQKVELKSCPFCGGGAELFTVQHGGCKSNPMPEREDNDENTQEDNQ